MPPRDSLKAHINVTNLDEKTPQQQMHLAEDLMHGHAPQQQQQQTSPTPQLSPQQQQQQQLNFEQQLKTLESKLKPIQMQLNPEQEVEHQPSKLQQINQQVKKVQLKLELLHLQHQLQQQQLQERISQLPPHRFRLKLVVQQINQQFQELMLHKQLQHLQQYQNPYPHLEHNQQIFDKKKTFILAKLDQLDLSNQQIYEEQLRKLERVKLYFLRMQVTQQLQQLKQQINRPQKDLPQESQQQIQQLKQPLTELQQILIEMQKLKPLILTLEQEVEEGKQRFSLIALHHILQQLSHQIQLLQLQQPLQKLQEQLNQVKQEIELQNPELKEPFEAVIQQTQQLQYQVQEIKLEEDLNRLQEQLHIIQLQGQPVWQQYLVIISQVIKFNVIMKIHKWLNEFADQQLKSLQIIHQQLNKIQEQLPEQFQEQVQ